MCTTARMTYILTYRALREFANGRKSTNPIEEMHKMETCVPLSICSHTHDVMMKANRSFNQRCQKPSIVHEPIFINRAKHLRSLSRSWCHWDGKSDLGNWYLQAEPAEITRLLNIARNRANARKVNRYWFHLAYQDTLARFAKAQSKLAFSA